MHFALPPRKPSNPGAYSSRKSKLPFLRRKTLQLVAIIALSAIATFWGLSRLLRTAGSATTQVVPVKPAGVPDVVIVTVIDKKWKESHVEAIKKNRADYAAKHGPYLALPSLTGCILTLFVRLRYVLPVCFGLSSTGRTLLLGQGTRPSACHGHQPFLHLFLLPRPHRYNRKPHPTYHLTYHGPRAHREHHDKGRTGRSSR